MQKQRAIVVGGAAAVIMGSGLVSAPELGTVDIADPGASNDGDVFVGPQVETSKGPTQVQIVVTDGVITDVQVLKVGSQAAESLRVNAFAIPELVQKVIEAQDWDVDQVSGSSFTSPAFVESVHGAFVEAGLA